MTAGTDTPELGERISALLSEWKLPTAAAELVRRLLAGGHDEALAVEVGEVVAHPQLAGRWVPVSAGGREVQMLPPPVTHSGFGPVLGPVPRHGEHTEAVLAELAAGTDGAAR